MAELGLVNGVGNGKFNPEGILTQQEYFTILGRAIRYLDVDFDWAMGMIPQEDLDILKGLGFHNWALESTALLDLAGALCVSGERLEPTQPILREEAAACLHTVLAEIGILPH
jgi:hypothetical protein